MGESTYMRLAKSIQILENFGSRDQKWIFINSWRTNPEISHISFCSSILKSHHEQTQCLHSLEISNPLRRRRRRRRRSSGPRHGLPKHGRSSPPDNRLPLPVLHRCVEPGRSFPHASPPRFLQFPSPRLPRPRPRRFLWLAPVGRSSWWPIAAAVWDCLPSLPMPPELPRRALRWCLRLLWEIRQVGFVGCLFILSFGSLLFLVLDSWLVLGLQCVFAGVPQLGIRVGAGTLVRYCLRDSYSCWKGACFCGSCVLFLVSNLMVSDFGFVCAGWQGAGFTWKEPREIESSWLIPHERFRGACCMDF